MASTLNSANDDLVLNATGGSDLVFQQDGVEKGRVGAGGFGKVLQVVSGTLDTKFSQLGETWSNTGLEATITPTTATSKILVIVKLNCTNGSTGYRSHSKLLRDSTPVGNGISTALQSEVFGSMQGASVVAMHDLGGTFLDSPNTTGAITYKMQAAAEGGSSTYVNHFSTDTNNFYAPKAMSTITLMEIGE